jgi:fructuronate reductase
LGAGADFHTQLQPILSNDKIFGVDLYAVGLGEKVEDYFNRLVAQKGAVRKTLKQVVGE